MKEITSLSNSIIQQVKKLKDKKERDLLGQFIVEGANIIKDLPDSVSVQYLFVEKSKLDTYSDIIKKYDQDKICVVSDKVMKALSDTQTPCGLLCTAIKPKSNFDGGNVVILDRVSDPGNFGTIIRTCVACGIKTIFAIDTVDPYSMKVVRSSMGGIFRVNIVLDSFENIYKKLNGYNLITLDMGGENIYSTKNVKSPFALIVGNEAHGVSSEIKNSCTTTLSLPMIGDIESLNAAVSLSVALYHLSFAN